MPLSFGITLDSYTAHLRPNSARVAGVALAALVAACGTEPPDPVSGFRATATVEEIMRSMIDPAADAVWDAVVTTSTVDGIHEEVPDTDEEWVSLRRNAITLVEATNLLLIDGRAIARAESRSELPGIDLEPEEIEALVTEDRETWTRLVAGLQRSALTVLEAVDARDAGALLAAGDGLDLACEMCHSRYWYPGHGDSRAENPAP